MAEVPKHLRAGFTGTVNEERPKVGERAKQVAATVREEAAAVADTARDHPTATTGALLAVGVIGFVLGYLLGTGSSQGDRSRW